MFLASLLQMISAAFWYGPHAIDPELVELSWCQVVGDWPASTQAVRRASLMVLLKELASSLRLVKSTNFACAGPLGSGLWPHVSAASMPLERFCAVQLL